jgi:hypothetical protein
MGAQGAGGALGQVLGVVVDAAARLGRTFTDPRRFRTTIGRLGWDVAEPPAEYVVVGRRAQDIAASVRSWADAPPSLTQVVALTASLATLWEDVAGLDAVPAGVDAARFRDDVAGPLVELLLLDALNDLLPGWYAVAAVCGIAGSEDEPAAAGRHAHLRERLHLDRLGGLVADPVATFAAAAGWGSAEGASAEVVGRLAAVAAGAGLPTVARVAREDELGATLAATGARSADLHGVQLLDTWTEDDVAVEAGFDVLAVGSGPQALVEVRPRFDAKATGSLDLGGDWSLELTTDLDPAGVPGVVLTPGALSVDRPPSASDGSLELRLVRAPLAPLVLVGAPRATRLELGALAVGLGLSTTPEPDLTGTLELDELALVIAAGDGNGFLAGILGLGDQRYEASAALSYGATSGFSAAGAGGLALTVPVGRTLGPVTLERLVLDIGTDLADPSVLMRGRARVDLGGSLLALRATVDGIGVELALRAGGTTPAPDVAVGFVPPSSVGLSIDDGVIRGGGFVAVEPDTGRYAGGLGFDALGVGIDAIVVVDTQLPASPGWALFASLSARFPGVPLGFGFTLTGVGGIVTLNREVDGEALALGLRDGAVDALLFPEDLERDAAVLIGGLDAYFPPAPGNTVIGPVVEIGWGAPTIVTAQLGVIVSLPQGVITVLGSLTALLPKPEAPLLELNLDSLGVVDVPGGTVLVTATLYDSRLLGVIELSGDAGFYVSVVEDPYFLMTVGGYHPGFRPPSHVPAALEAPRRMRADVEVGDTVSATITAYFAVTSNTVQFGGGFELEASAAFLGITYTARGWFEFDVLLQFDPFALIADVTAGVGVYAGTREVLGVDLSAHLEGPEPWFANATGRFRFFLIHVHFDVTVGAHTAPTLPDVADVLALVATELASPEAWSARHPSAPPAGLRLRADLDDAVVRPDDSVVAIQSVAPLGETLERFGELTPLQDEVHVAATTVVDGATGEALDELVVEAVTGWFAPAQFETLRDEDRLASPSYELDQAGVAFGGGGFDVPGDELVAAPAGYETEVWEPDTDVRKALGVVTAAAPLDVVLAASATGRQVAAWRGAAIDVEPVAVAPTAYVVVDAATGLPAAEGDGETRVVPAHAVAVAA